MKYALIAGILTATSPFVSAVEVGQPAPDIAVPSTDGTDVSMADFQGQWIILYFYPKSFTPGCTRQACSIRDGYDHFSEDDVVVFGASMDSIDVQHKFKEKHSLPFDLLADESKELSKAFGVSGFGGLMASRVSFIIAPDGTVVRIIDDVTPSTHAEDMKRMLDEERAQWAGQAGTE